MTIDVEPATYDLEAVYDEQIAPLMAQIITICQTHNMPMLASFAYRYNGHDDFEACSTALLENNRAKPPAYYEIIRILTEQR